MQRTEIEWVREPDGRRGFSWNPVTGCKMGCTYCYARDIALLYTGTFEPEYHPDRLMEPSQRRKSSTIFLCSMSDLWGLWVPEHWQLLVMGAVIANPQHRFLMCTKSPEVLLAWLLRFPTHKLPDNLAVGVTIDYHKHEHRISLLRCIPASMRFISFEPALDLGTKIMDLKGIDWIIAGPLNKRGRCATTESHWWDQYITICHSLLLSQPLFIKNTAPMHQERPQQFPAWMGIKEVPHG